MGVGPDSVQLLYSTKLISNFTHISPTVYCVAIMHGLINILITILIFFDFQFAPNTLLIIYAHSREKSKKIVSVGTSLESKPGGNVMGMQEVLITVNNCINNLVCFLYTLRATVAL